MAGTVSESPDLEERVAALEAIVATPLKYADFPQVLTEEELAKFRVEFKAACGQPMRIMPPPPPLTPDEIRHLLRECVTVVEPGETLVVRVPWTVNPAQLYEYQRVMDSAEGGAIPFKVLVVAGDELGVVQPEPAFMSETRADTSRDILGDDTETIRLTHLPTGVTVQAPTREEAVAKLGRAIERHARRHAEEAPGAA